VLADAVPGGDSQPAIIQGARAKLDGGHPRLAALFRYYGRLTHMLFAPVDKRQLPLFPGTAILDTEFTDSLMTSRMMRKGHATWPVRHQALRSPHPIPRSCLKCMGTGGAFNRGARHWDRWVRRVAGASRSLCRSRAGNRLASGPHPPESTDFHY
jgi:hypothetical protein